VTYENRRKEGPPSRRNQGRVLVATIIGLLVGLLVFLAALIVSLELDL
jgi:hypothetical protein